MTPKRRLIRLYLVLAMFTATAAHAEDVVWTSASGVTVSGNDLTKTATTGWGNAGAISTAQMDGGAAYVEFVATETNTLRLCGLSNGNSTTSNTDVDFGIQLNASAAYQAYEAGVAKGSSGSYVSGDRFRVEAQPGLVRYLKNGSVFYTSAASPKFPLLVDTALNTNGATLTDVVVGTSVFFRSANVTVSGGTLTKTGTAGWNAGAISAARIETGDGYLDFVATETYTSRAGGLSRGDGGTDVSDIDFAVHVKADGTVEVLEGGTPRGNFGSYSSGDVFRVELLGGVVRYKKNGSTFYTSTDVPVYPIVMDSAFDTVGATLSDVKLVTVLWTNAASVSVSGGSLTKTGSGGWNGGASSTSSFTGDGWMEFSAAETTTDRVAGLSNGDSSQADTDVDYGIWLKSDGTVAVLEAGVNRGAFGSYAGGDRFRVEVSSGAVKYRKNGVVIYSSTITPTFPLLIDTALDEVGATVRDVTVGRLVWKSDVGVAVGGLALRNTATVWGTSGAISSATLDAGDGWVEFAASETVTSQRMLGLGNGNSSASYTDIDFAIYQNGNDVRAYENGMSRNPIVTVVPGDLLRVEVAGGVVRYFKNGVAFYTSGVTPTYPLLVDTAFNTSGATLVNATLGGGWTGMVATPALSPAGGTYTSAQTVSVSCSTSGAEIRYTTDGSTPTASSTLYTTPLNIATTTTVKARGWKAGSEPSAVASATYQMNFGTAPAPTFSPAAGTYTSSVSVTLSSTLSGATIRYTTDGSEPTSGSTAYTGPIALATTTTVKAKTFHPDYTTSATATAAYTIEVAQPTFTPDGGTQAAGTTITVATATAGATIHYTLNGAEPTTSDPVIPSGGTLVVGNYTLKAKASKTGCAASPTKSADYVITGQLTPGAFASSRFLSLALKHDGTVWAWGNGPLGDGTSGISSIPRRVAGLTGVVGIAVGSDFSVALRQDGTVWTWGSDDNGTLGNGATTGVVLIPSAIGLTGVTAVSAGEVHVLARKSDGTVVSWGVNTNGQLGDGTTTLRTSPVPIPDVSGVTAVVAGARHSVALLSDGTVRAWGANGFSQVGDGTTTDRLAPVRVDGLTSITAIASGWYHTLALRDDATVWAWGDNTSFGLGDGTSAVRTTPVRSFIEGATAIAAGSSHSMALKAGGSLWTWGADSSGVLGNGAPTADVKVPTPVSGVSGLVVLGSSQYGNPRALTSDRRVLSWGRNPFNESSVGDGTAIERNAPTEISGPDFEWKVGTPTFTISAVARGAFETISAPSTVTFGVATAGATIRYTTNGQDPTETDTAIAAGGTLAVDSTMTLKARAFKAGMPASNVDGLVFALKPATPSFSPTPAATYTTAQNVTISCTTSSVTIRYTTDGSEPTAASTAYSGPIPTSTLTTFKAKAFRSGWTESDTATATYTFDLGTSTTPTISPAAGPYTDSVSVTLSAPAGCSIRYTTNGSDPTTGSPLYSAPFAITANGTVKARAWCVDYAQSAVASAVYSIQPHAPVLSPAGGTYAYGQNVTITSDVEGGTLRYTLGGADPTVNDPVIASGTTLSLVANSTIKARVFKTGLADGVVASGVYTITGSGTNPGTVGAGADFSFAVKPDGSVWAWGRNGSRQLGDGLTATAPTPKPVTGFGTLSRIDGGTTHTLALRTDGKVWAAGANGQGQLGQNNTSTYTNPVEVLNLSSVTSVAAGEDHGLAVSGGSAWAWGSNNAGQIGDNTTVNRWTAVQPQGLTSGVIAVAAGYEFSLALKSDGTVWAWGADNFGKLGNDTTFANSLLPVQVSGITTAVAVAAGRDHGLALLADGTVRAWGRNWYGQLGEGGQVTNSGIPVTVAGLAGVRAIAASYFTSAAARTDGSVVTWGHNGLGSLGVTGDHSYRAVFVPGLAGIVGIAGGGYQMLALGRDGALWAWGYNEYSQVGDGTTLDRFRPVKIADAALEWAVPMPTISVAAGTYTAEQTVTLGGAITGALIHYTTNGLDPTQTDPSVSPGGAVTITQSATLKAKAFKSGLPPSDVVSATYTLQVPIPTFSATSGTYFADFPLTLSTPGVTGTTIRYTTHPTAIGSTCPTETWPSYTGPITIDRTMTICAKAWRTGWTESTETEASRTYDMKVATPVLSPAPGSYSSAQTVTVSTTTPGATLRHTTDGGEPTDGGPTIASGGTVVVDKSATLAIRGYRPGWTESDIVWAPYSVSLGTLAAPTLTPAAGTYTSVQSVALSGPSGAALRYTTDGSEPTFASRLYTGPIPVDATMTVKAKAFKEDYASSATTSNAYTVTLSNTVEAVTFNPPAGSYTTTRTVTLTTATAGAAIHYTTNGLDPTTSDPSVVSGGTVTIDRHLPLKARAFKAAMTASPIRTAVYRISGAIGAGHSHACLVKADGTVWCFGGNALGQLGDGTTTNRNAPVQVTGLTDVVRVMPSGYDHSLAVKADGTVRAWGYNIWGMLGDGTTTNQWTPVAVSGLTGAQAVAAGIFHSLALKNDGTVWSWGDNAHGQLGDGTTTDHYTAAQVGGLADVVAIAAGWYHSVALKRDGTVWTWGDNERGQLGDGTTTDRLAPVQVPGLTGVVAIAAAGYHTRALKTGGAVTGSMWVWGGNAALALGTGSTSVWTALLTPTRVLTNVAAMGSSAEVGLALTQDSRERALLAAGTHNGNTIAFPGSDGISVLPNSTAGWLTLSKGPFVDVAAATTGIRMALRWDTTLFAWGNYPAANGFVLGNGGAFGDDPDGDGLTTAEEWALGTDPWTGDTNGDGISDSEAIATGRSATNLDMDGDGVVNAAERNNGTDPFRTDTDNDTVGDGTDCFPLDPTRTTCPTPTPGDTTPPTITLTEPTNAVLQ